MKKIKNENAPNRHIASFIINVKLHFYKMAWIRWRRSIQLLVDMSIHLIIPLG